MNSDTVILDKEKNIMWQFILKYFPAVRSYTQLVAVVAIGLLLAAAVLPQTVMAGVEFVTTVGTCTKVDTIGDGKDLSVQAGNNMRFEVWGFGVDLVNTIRVTVDDNNNDSLVTARIIRRHNGAENLLRGCRQATGSVEVEVDSPAEAGKTRQRSLWFADSRLQMRVVPFQTPVWMWGDILQSPVNCLDNTYAQVVKDLNDSRLTINMRRDSANITSKCLLEFTTYVKPESLPEIDIQGPFSYTVTLPPIISLKPGTNNVDPDNDATWRLVRVAQIRLIGDVAAIRGTEPTRYYTLKIATPNPNKIDTLTLVINPPPPSFTKACQCRNAVTGTTINVGDTFNCELSLSHQPPAVGQLITFSVSNPGCAARGGTNVFYDTIAANTTTDCLTVDTDGKGTYMTAPNTLTQIIPFKAVNCYGPGTAGLCAPGVQPTTHTLKFWVGPSSSYESGPYFTSCQIQIRRPL
jgi:hypothetical protein